MRHPLGITGEHLSENIIPNYRTFDEGMVPAAPPHIPDNLDLYMQAHDGPAYEATLGSASPAQQDLNS